MSSDIWLHATQDHVNKRMVKDYLWTPFDDNLCMAQRDGVQRRFAEIVTPERIKRGRLAAPLVLATPSVWVGTVSWARATFSSSPQRYAAAHVRAIYDLCLHVPLITESLIQSIRDVLDQPDKSIYKYRYTPEMIQNIPTYLENNVGRYAYTTSSEITNPARKSANV